MERRSKCSTWHSKGSANTRGFSLPRLTLIPPEGLLGAPVSAHVNLASRLVVVIASLLILPNLLKSGLQVRVSLGTMKLVLLHVSCRPTW